MLELFSKHYWGDMQNREAKVVLTSSSIRVRNVSWLGV